MAFYLEKAIFINRAPFDHLELDFKEKGINVLSAINGKGKTTILSHVADAFYEMAKNGYSYSFQGKENEFYRFSSNLFHLNMSKYSIVYLRFKYKEEFIDYIDCRGEDLTKEQYEKEIGLQNIIPYNDIQRELKWNKCAKIFSKALKNEKVREIFEGNVLTFFPVYRYENPYYLNDPYKISMAFESNVSISGYLKNPIEVITEIQMLANWIMDIVLDKEIGDKGIDGVKGRRINLAPEKTLFSNICKILSAALSSKYKDGCLEFHVGKRNKSGQRISIMQILKNDSPRLIAPNIFFLSSGELSLLCLFGEIMRQADNLHANILLDNIEGLVLIDEVDLHLHIKQQKEILPKLFNLYPRIQFIVSTHSPFLNMGLADNALERTQIIDLDNNGIICSPTKNELYNEVYNMMIAENERFADKYNELLNQIKQGRKPLVITEGETDYKHIRNAIKVLKRTDIDVDFHEIPNNDGGSSELKKMLETLSRIKQQRIIIGIFDRDEQKLLSYLNADNQEYKCLGNNVYAFAIPLVNESLYGTTISIEHYYKKNNLLKEDPETSRRLFLGSEFYGNGNSKDGKYQTRISNIQHKVKINGIIDEKVFKRDDLEQKKSIALTKDAFVDLIENNTDYASDFDFSDFNKIIDTIKKISELPLV